MSRLHDGQNDLAEYLLFLFIIACLVITGIILVASEKSTPRNEATIPSPTPTGSAISIEQYALDQFKHLLGQPNADLKIVSETGLINYAAPNYKAWEDHFVLQLNGTFQYLSGTCFGKYGADTSCRLDPR